jgi:FAD/FMN-containing dehydrogenase
MFSSSLRVRSLTLTPSPYGLPVPYRKYQGRFAEICAAHGGRPHWAKEHSLTPKGIEALYPRFGEFRDVLARVDPDGIMRSEYVRRHIDGEEVATRLFKRRP